MTNLALKGFGDFPNWCKNIYHFSIYSLKTFRKENIFSQTSCWKRQDFGCTRSSSKGNFEVIYDFFLKKNYQLFLLVQGKRMMIKICSVNIKGHLNLLIGKKKTKCLTEKWNNRTKTLHISLSWRSLTNRLVKHIAHLSRTAEIFLIFWTNTCYLLISETSTPVCWQEMNSALSFSPVQRGHLLLTYSSQKSLFPFALSCHV